MTIAFVIATTAAGGAERVAAVLCNRWQQAGHAVRMVTFEPPGRQAHYALSPDVEIRRLDIMRPSRGIAGAAGNNVRRILTLRRCLQGLGPDITLSFATETNVLTLLASMGAPWPTVVSERVHAPAHAVGRSWDLLRRWTYRRADATVVQTEAMARWAHAALGIAAEVIPNSVDTAAFHNVPAAPAADGRRLLLAVGRLEQQKGFDLLIRAFAGVADQLATWDVAIVGEGSQRPMLEALIAGAGMSGRISLAGIARDMAATYARATAVVHPARYEGYPNVIAEALAAGKPIIATDCPGATRDLLAGGRYGVLVPCADVRALQQRLVETLSSDHTLARMRERAQAAHTLVPPATIAARWIALFERVIAARRRSAGLVR